MTANRALMDELGFALKHDERQGWLVIEDGADDRCATITERVLWDALLSQAATVAPAGKALVPLVMTQAMRDVTDGDEWDWPDLLAAAESITEKQHAELSAAAPIAPELDVTKILLRVVPGYEGEGLEIYAKSVDDVVALLTKQGERIEELESRVAAPVTAKGITTMNTQNMKFGDIDDCPFCGNSWGAPSVEQCADGGRWIVACTNPRCGGASGFCDTAQGARDTWNARAFSAPVAPALKYVDDPKQTGVGSWCAPGPAAEQKRMFVLRFEDQDRGEAHYTDEAEARAMFARAEARGWNCHLFVHVNRVAPVAPAEPAEGWVLVPKRMTQEMRDVTDSEGWTWEDLLAEAGSISQEEYAAIAAAPVAPTEWTDAKLRGIASDYFPDRAHWPAAMLCLRHLLMEQSKFGATVAPVDHDEFSLFRNDLCDFLRHVIDMGKGDHYWDVVRGNAGALLRRVARIAPAVAPVAPAEPTHLRRADGTLSGVFIEPVTSDAAAVAADLRNWFNFLPGHAQPTIERAVRLLETRP